MNSNEWCSKISQHQTDPLLGQDEDVKMSVLQHKNCCHPVTQDQVLALCIQILMAQ